VPIIEQAAEAASDGITGRDRARGLLSLARHFLGTSMGSEDVTVEATDGAPMPEAHS
jgi:hypothetical protein